MPKGVYIRRVRPWNWKGRLLTSHGYVTVTVGTDHHLADAYGRAYEHRLVAEEKLGRRLEPGEQVHHINGDGTDNRPENLEVLASRAHHKVRHRSVDGKRLPDEPNPDVVCECGCGTLFPKYDRWNRPRRYVRGHRG